MPGSMTRLPGARQGHAQRVGAAACHGFTKPPVTFQERCHLPSTFARPKGIELAASIAASGIAVPQPYLEDGTACRTAKRQHKAPAVPPPLHLTLRESRVLGALTGCLATSRR